MSSVNLVAEGFPPNAGFPANLMPPPTRALFSHALYTNTWQAYRGMDGLGDASFDIPATGASTSGGLRVFFEGALAGAAGAGYTASVVSGGTTGVAVDEDAKTVVVTIAANATLGDVKTAVDADARLTSIYFDDGAAGNDADTVAEHTVRDGHAPRRALVRVRKDNDALAYVGTEAPDSDISLTTDTGIDGVVWLKSGDTSEWFTLPPGERLFVRRQGSSDISGCLELWK